MKFSQHVAVGISTYLVVLVPISAWIVFREGLSIAGLWQDSWSLLIKHWWEILICFGLCMLGAMMPDVDIKSKSQKIIYSILIVINLVLILFRYYRPSAILGFLAMIPMLTKHREQFHSFVAAIIVPAPLLFIPVMVTGNLAYKQLGVSYYISAVFGYLSHIIADRGGD